MKFYIRSILIFLCLGFSSESEAKDGWMLVVCADLEKSCKYTLDTTAAVGFIEDRITCQGKALMLENLGVSGPRCIKCESFAQDSCGKWDWNKPISSKSSLK